MVLAAIDLVLLKAPTEYIRRGFFMLILHDHDYSIIGAGRSGACYRLIRMYANRKSKGNYLL